MNYRHSYHAGNFADVFKHVILIQILQSLLQKENPICYIETHAGAGYYALNDLNAQKSKEYETGIAKILAATHPPEIIKSYLSCIKNFNRTINITAETANILYPGSPAFVHAFLRPQDRMVLSELHPEESQALKKFFRHDKRVTVHAIDGYQSLKAFLPPKERRGLVLIDPPYETTEDFSKLPERLELALKRWETGMYAIWYPLKHSEIVTKFHREISQRIKRPLLTAELSIMASDVGTQLHGCGILIINPPWKLEEPLHHILSWLLKVLSIADNGCYKIKQ